MISRCGSQLYQKDFMLEHCAEQNNCSFNKQHPMNSLQALTTRNLQAFIQDDVVIGPNEKSQQPRNQNVNKYKFPGAFPCPRCRKEYRYRTNMLRHLKVECGKEPQFHCPYCPCQTKHKSSMQRHIENRHSLK